MPLPDHGFDVVLEEHGRRRRAAFEIHARRQEVTDHYIVMALVQLMLDGLLHRLRAIFLYGVRQRRAEIEGQVAVKTRAELWRVRMLDGDQLATVFARLCD